MDARQGSKTQSSKLKPKIKFSEWKFVHEKQQIVGGARHVPQYILDSFTLVDNERT